MYQAAESSNKVLRNCMEDLVDRHIDDIMQHYPDLCSCEDCRLDVFALALNLLPCRYIITDKGELYSKVEMLDNQFQVKVVTAISKAIMIVDNNPRHVKKSSGGN